MIFKNVALYYNVNVYIKKSFHNIVISNHFNFLNILINDNHWLDHLKSFSSIQYSLDSFEFFQMFHNN
jgi:hypothetical protein